MMATGGSMSSGMSVRTFFGQDAILLPTPPGEKGPRIPGWQKITVDQARSPEHRALLRDDLAVRLGPAGGDIVDLDIDYDAAVEPFLLLNPALEKTLQTRAERGRHFVMRMSGRYPEGIHHITDLRGTKIGEFRADGVTKVSGTHPSGCSYAILNEAAPIKVSFQSIVWPENWHLPWAADPHEEVVRLAGPAFVENRTGLALNAQFFAHLIARSRDIVFEECEGRFYIWDPATGIWIPRPVIKVREAVYACYRDWVAGQETDIQDALKVRASRKFGDDAVEILKGIVLQRDFFAPRPLGGHMVACSNGGLLITASGVIGPVPLTAELRLKHRIAHSYDPGATCPRFLAMLSTVADPDEIDLLQRVVGSMMVSLNRGQQVSVVTGPTNSGKGTLLAILENLLGGDRVGQLRAEHLEGRFEVGALADCTHLFAPDCPVEFLSEKGARVLKSLVGGDVLRGELKYSNSRVKIRGEFHVLIDTNHALTVPGGDDPGAWRRRLVIVRLARSVPESHRRPNFAQALLRDEAKGILAWAMAGGCRAAEEIESHGRLRLTDAQQVLVNRAVRLPGRVDDFVRQRVARGRGDLTTAELVAGYAAWCDAGGLVAEPAAAVARDLARTMPGTFGVHPAHNIDRDGKQANGYRGVVLR